MSSAKIIHYKKPKKLSIFLFLPKPLLIEFTGIDEVSFLQTDDYPKVTLAKEVE